MMRNALIWAGIAAYIAACGVLEGGERGFSWTYAPRGEDRGRADLSQYSLSHYLGASDLDRPEIVAEVKALLASGEHYRKRTSDQKGKPTLATIFVDRENTLTVVTYRDETCPDCNGTGTRKSPFDRFQDKAAIGVVFECITCKGTGVLKDHLSEKSYILSSEDYQNPEQARAMLAERSFRGAPPDTAAWIERLVSKDPNERLAACEWLDQNYVDIGKTFQEVMPMIKKARYQETSKQKRMMVWQFWAAKDLPEQRKRAYYRIYADSRSGKIVKKGFASGR